MGTRVVSRYKREFKSLIRSTPRVNILQKNSVSLFVSMAPFTKFMCTLKGPSLQED